MRFSICQCERAAPGTTKDLPAIDAEVFAYTFNILDEVPGGVVFEIGVRSALAGSALIEEHHAISLRIKILAVERLEPATWPKYQNDWLAIGFRTLVIEL